MRFFFFCRVYLECRNSRYINCYLYFYSFFQKSSFKYFWFHAPLKLAISMSVGAFVTIINIMIIICLVFKFLHFRGACI